MADKRIETEHARLEGLLDKAEVAQQHRAALAGVIDNMAWQRVALDDAREGMTGATLVCEYDNGGGQKGTRENPIFKAYINLYRAYMLGVDKFTSYLPAGMKDEAAGDTISVLEEVRRMKAGA